MSRIAKTFQCDNYSVQKGSLFVLLSFVILESLLIDRNGYFIGKDAMRTVVEY